MDRSFDIQLDDLRKMILAMGAKVEEALQLATVALMKKQADKFSEVHTIENTINEIQIRVDEACLKYLAKQGPVAKDLRFIFSLIKINSDLERMGDQAVNIAFTGKDFLTRKSIPLLSEIEEMSTIVSKMVRESLDCFVREDAKHAERILLMDDEVDQKKDIVFQKMTAFMRQNPDFIESAMDVILIARNLERLGDHATNIAEDVIFVTTGEDVRHGGKFN